MGGGRFGGELNVSALVDRVFAAKDAVDPDTAEADGLLSAEELGSKWERLSEAAGEDGLLSPDELTDFINSKIAERNAEEEESEESKTGGEETDAEETSSEVAARPRFSRAIAMARGRFRR